MNCELITDEAKVKAAHESIIKIHELLAEMVEQGLGGTIAAGCCTAACLAPACSRATQLAFVDVLTEWEERMRNEAMMGIVEGGTIQ